MGCFNMTCVVTNTPICYGDEAAAIKIVKDNYAYNGELFGREYFLADLPVFGVYNDYGSLDIDEEGNTYPEDREDVNVIFIHRYAYDILMDNASKRKEYFKVNFKEYHETNLKQEENICNLINEIKDYDYDDSKDIKELVAFSNKETIVREGCRISDFTGSQSYWFEKVMSSDDPLETYRGLNDIIRPLTCGLIRANARIYPSLYAGQEVDTDIIYALKTATIDHFFKKDMEYDMDEDIQILKNTLEKQLQEIKEVS